jgi:hypothetical protein
MELFPLFRSVVQAAVEQMKEKTVPVFTFAFYHDRESRAISVCVDTEANSQKIVLSINAYNVRYFLKNVAADDLNSAGLWDANIGRSLSLGDFAFVNVARVGIDDVQVDDRFYLSMIKALIASHEQVAALAPAPERLIFACSGPNDEVEYVWSLPGHSRLDE